MASRNVALRMDAYHALDAARRPGESFSDVVVRLAAGRRSVADIVASFEPLPEAQVKAFDRELRAIRKETERSFRGRRR